MRKLFIVLLIMLLSASCTTTGRRSVNLGGDVQQDEVIIVGKIQFDPPLPEDKQKLLIQGSEVYRNTMQMICGEKLLQFDDDESFLPWSDIYKGMVNVFLGKTFYAANAKNPFYMVAGSVYMEIYEVSGFNSVTTYYKPMAFPASFYIDIQPEDKAVYVGTITYHRDNFYNLKKITISDEYDHEMPLFRRRFGPIKLRKAMIRQPSADAEYKIGSPY
jgi:hypothetical protein